MHCTVNYARTSPPPTTVTFKNASPYGPGHLDCTMLQTVRGGDGKQSSWTVLKASSPFKVPKEGGDDKPGQSQGIIKVLTDSGALKTTFTIKNQMLLLIWGWLLNSDIFRLHWTQSPFFSPFRDWALFASLALLHDHGGQFSEGGRAAIDARSSCSLPPLAKPGWLAGAADSHYQPFRSDAALRVVSPTLWRHLQWDWKSGVDSSRSEPGDGLYSTHCKAVLSTLLFNSQTILSFFGFLPPLGAWSNHPLSPRPSHPFFSPPLLCRIFPESLRWLLATQHYKRSKEMMLRIARKNRVDMSTEPSGLLTGEDRPLKEE